jgi:WD40 repeat protein
MYGDEALAFSPHGTTLAAGGVDGALRVWNMADGQQIAGPFGSGGTVDQIAFSPDGKTLVTGNADGTVRLWDMTSATFRQIGSGAPIAHAFPITWAAFTPGGKSLITLTGNGTVQVWNMAANGRRAGERSFNASPDRLEQLNPGSVALSPDGRWLVTGALAWAQPRQIGVAEVWDVATGQAAGWVLPAGTNVPRVAFTPDGDRLITLATDDSGGQLMVQVWNMANRHQIGETRPLPSEDSTQLTTDGTILSASDLGPVRMQDAVTGKPAGKPIAVHPGVVTWLALSPDGKTLAVGSPNGAAQLWNVTTGQPVSSMSGGSALNASAVFSPDGAVLATVAASEAGNGPARLWDVASGQPIGGPVGGSSSSAAAAFSPDGRTLAIVSDNGAVQLWNVSYLTDPLAQLCARIGGSITPAEWAQYVPAGPTYRNGCP